MAGDIAFTSFNADEGGWALAAFAPISANTTIYFSDNEWNGSPIGSGGAFNSGEGYWQWNSGINAIAAGTVIRFLLVNESSLSASTGTLSRATVSGSSNWTLSSSTESIYAYLGSAADTPTTFLTFLTNANLSATNGNVVNTGLTIGTNAIQLTSSTDFGQYTASRSNQSTFDAYTSLVNTPANWTLNVDGNGSSFVPDLTAFTITAVPEASAFLLVGLVGAISAGTVSVVRRRPPR